MAEREPCTCAPSFMSARKWRAASRGSVNTVSPAVLRYVFLPTTAAPVASVNPLPTQFCINRADICHVVRVRVTDAVGAEALHHPGVGAPVHGPGAHAVVAR